MRRSTRAVAGKAFDVDTSAHHVLGHAGAGAAFDGDVGMHIHARCVVTGMAVHQHLEWGIQPCGDVVRAVGVVYGDGAALGLAFCAVQKAVELTHRLLAQIEIYAFHMYISWGAGSNT